MESLLTVAFDNLSSRRHDTTRIRKGLKQIESLLAQVCLSPPPSQSPSPNRRRSSVMRIPVKTVAKPFGQLLQDAAYLEFYRLQDSFEWNVATRLVECLERLLGMGSSEIVDQTIVSTLDILLGTLLLHPPSKSLFGRELHMNLLLDLILPTTSPSILSQTLSVLLATLLDPPRNNLRAFENADGLHTLTYLYKASSTPKHIKSQIAEILHCYVLPENAAKEDLARHGERRRQSASPEKMATRQGSDNSGVSLTVNVMAAGLARTAAEKESLLDGYLGGQRF